MPPEDNQIALLSDQDSDQDVAYESGEKVHIVGINEPDDDGSLGVPPFSWKKLWLFTGPGFLMSIAFLDRSTLQEVEFNKRIEKIKSKSLGEDY